MNPDAPTIHPKPSQIVYGKDDPMFTLKWRNHSRGDRKKENDPEAAPRGHCQRCGQVNLRYVHLMESPDFPDRIEVGCECAQVLDPKYDAVKAERLMKTRDRRLAHWLSLPWLSVIGNQYLNHAGFNCGVVRVEGGWGWWIKGAVSIASEVVYDTHAKARVALFDYIDACNMRGELAPSLQPVTLIASLQDIEQICNCWGNGFSWLSDEYYRLDRFSLLGKIGCSVYINGHSTPYWELSLTLPDEEDGSKKYYGPKRTCPTAVEAKIAALDIFRKEMVRIAYERAGISLEVLLPPLTAADRQKIADAHLRAENERDARRVAEQRAFEEEQRRREREEQLVEQLQNHAPPQPPAPTATKTAKLNLDDYRRQLRTLGPSPQAALQLGMVVAVAGIRGLFRQTSTGNYTAVAHVEGAPVRCNVFRRPDETWSIGVFAPFDLIHPWSAQSFPTADEALEAAPRVYHAKIVEWARAVLKGVERK